MAKTLTPDKFASDPKPWRICAQFNLDAARVLFTHEAAIMLCFPAATLAHLGLEAMLKTALIREGFTIFDPMKLKQLSASTLTRDKCAWGHNLVALARLLTSKRPDFDLQKPLRGVFPPHDYPVTIEDGLEIFDPYFSELRYPQQLNNLQGIGPDDIRMLDAIAEELLPFAGPL
ncbi:MAG TPA: hypothetical protein VFA99_17005 [Acidobacteriaceae bacterium]|nr:hypothetical protein [Acidobacteriaceae bacterium]